MKGIGMHTGLDMKLNNRDLSVPFPFLEPCDPRRRLLKVVVRTNGSAAVNQ